MLYFTAASTALAVLAAVVCWANGWSWRGAVPVTAVRAGAAARVQLGEQIAAVAHTWMQAHPSEALPLRWGEGVLVLGLQRAAERTGDAAIERYVHAYFARHAQGELDVRWSDEATPAIAAGERAARGDAEAARVLEATARYVRAAPRTTPHGMVRHFGRSALQYLSPPFPEAWVDSMFHVVPVLLRSAAIDGEAHDRDEAVRQALAFLRVLQDPDTGLVTHAADDGEPPRRVPSFAAREFWARGQGWALASGLEAWGALPDGAPERGELAARLTRLERALRARQAASGLFHTLVLRDDSYEETAGSALILYAMARGANAGLFGAETRAAVERGVRGLASVVRRDGSRAVVTGTSLGTNPWPAVYAYVPTAEDVSYGVGAWLLAACEIAGREVRGPAAMR